LRILAFLLGVLILFFISWRLGDKFSESSNIDKVFHILMSIFIALLLSVFFKDARLIIGMVLTIGFLWEVYQFYHDFNVFGANFRIKEFLGDSAGDLFADLAGAVFFVWWINPHI